MTENFQSFNSLEKAIDKNGIEGESITNEEFNNIKKKDILSKISGTPLEEEFNVVYDKIQMDLIFEKTTTKYEATPRELKTLRDVLDKSMGNIKKEVTKKVEEEYFSEYTFEEKINYLKDEGITFENIQKTGIIESIIAPAITLFAESKVVNNMNKYQKTNPTDYDFMRLKQSALSGDFGGTTLPFNKEIFSFIPDEIFKVLADNNVEVGVDFVLNQNVTFKAPITENITGRAKFGKDGIYIQVDIDTKAIKNLFN